MKCKMHCAGDMMQTFLILLNDVNKRANHSRLDSCKKY